MSYNATNYLIFQQNKPELDGELLLEFSPYLTMKTFSFYEGGKMVDYINDTLNRYGGLFESADDKFKFYEHVIPIQPKRRINYIKRPKLPSSSEDDKKPIPEFYSSREIDILDHTRKYLDERTTPSIH